MARLRVRVQPGAKRHELLGFREGVLRIRVTAPPIDGRANRALVQFVAQLLGLPRSKVNVVAGFAGRDKLVEVEGLDLETVAARLVLPGTG